MRACILSYIRKKRMKSDGRFYPTKKSRTDWKRLRDIICRWVEMDMYKQKCWQHLNICTMETLLYRCLKALVFILINSTCWTPFGVYRWYKISLLDITTTLFGLEKAPCCMFWPIRWVHDMWHVCIYIIMKICHHHRQFYEFSPSPLFRLLIFRLRLSKSSPCLW